MSECIILSIVDFFLFFLLNMYLVKIVSPVDVFVAGIDHQLNNCTIRSSPGSRQEVLNSKPLFQSALVYMHTYRVHCG